MSDALDDDLPTLLILGEGEPLLPGVQDALGRHATFVDAANADSPMAAVLASAPDLVVLVGDAAERAEEVLASLATHPVSRVVPVAVLLEANDLAARLKAVRSGVAVVDRSASVDAVAREIAGLVRAFSDREATVGGELGEATLGDVLDIVRRELEDGILTVGQRGGEEARFLLRRGRHVDDAIREFVTKIRPMLDAAQPLYFNYDNAGDRLELLDESTEEGDRGVFQGRRVALIEDDAALADALAQELRAHQAEVVVLASTGSGIERARALDPEIVLIDEKGLDGPAYDVLRQIRTDPRLRWASLLVIRGTELMPAGQAPRMDRLAGAFVPLLAADVDIKERAQEEERFDTRLEALGPSRLLRALVDTGHTFLVTVRHPRISVDVAVAQGLIAGASGSTVKTGVAMEGLEALSALLAISSGRVSVERREAPASANILMMLGDALEAAARENPPIRPSIFPAALAQSTSTPPARLIEELETILGRLRSESAPAEERTSAVPTLLTGARGATQNPSTTSKTALSDSVKPLPTTPTRGRERRPSPTDTAKTPLRPLSTPLSSSLSASLSTSLSTRTGDRKRAAPQAFAPKRRAPAHRTLVGHALSAAALSAAKRSAEAPKTPIAPSDPGQRPTPVVSLPPTSNIPVVPPPPPAPVFTARELTRNRPPPPIVAPLRKPPAVSAVNPKAVEVQLATPATSLSGSGESIVDDAPGCTASATDAFETQVPEMLFSDLADPADTADPGDLADPDDLADPGGFVDIDIAETQKSPPLTPVGAQVSPVAAPVAQVAQSSIDPSPGPMLSAGVSLDSEEVTYPRQRRWVPFAIAAVLAAAMLGLFIAYMNRPEGSAVATREPGGTAAAVADEVAQAAGGPDVPTAIPTPAEPIAEPVADDPLAGAEQLPDQPPEQEPEEQSQESPEELGTVGETNNPTLDMTAETEAGPGEHATRAERITWNLQSGNFHRNRGHLRAARQRYGRVLRLSRTNGRALAGLTRVALAEHNAEEAVRFARRLVRTNSNNAGNRVLLGDALAAAGQRSSATAEWQRAIQINPNHRAARRRLR